jgi:hypothetical protein
MEYRIAQHCMKRSTSDGTSSDFYEGIRATLIDKDHSPQWSPAILEDINKGKINRTYMQQPIPKEWELPSEYNLLELMDDHIDFNNPSTISSTATDSKL